MKPRCAGSVSWHGRPRVVGMLAALCAVLLAAPPAFAWGPRGHSVVARLAATQLTPQARAQVDRLLAVRGKRYLDQVANWADNLRRTDPALWQRTKRLHFVNFHSANCIYSPPLDCRRDECAVAAIAKYSAILKNRANPPAERAEALAFVVHFVADVHQPLHADYRRDYGGNDFQVRFDGRGTNLHRVWDSGLIDKRHLSAARYARMLEAETAPIVTGGTPAGWAEESCRLDRDGGVYPSSRFINQAYVERELPVVDRRLRQAGARLAELLNRDLATD